MDQGKDKPRILVLHRPSGENGEAWGRLHKALGTFANAELREHTAALTGQEPELSDFTHIYCDLALVSSGGFTPPAERSFTLVSERAFDWQNPQARQALLPLLREFSCLLLADCTVPDLVRITHLQLMPKRLPGVTAVLEKGSVVVGEKIQGTEGLGASIDKLITFLEGVKGFELTARLGDLRQVLSGALSEAVRLSRAAGGTYPTVDFQVGAARQKIVVNLRFPLAGTDPQTLPEMILNGSDLLWSQLWLCADSLLITHHTQYSEVEVLAIIHRAHRQPNAFRTLLRKTSDRSARQEQLTAPLQNYDFKVLSDIRANAATELTNPGDENNSGIDLGALPVPVVEKLEKYEKEASFRQDLLKKREAALAQLQFDLAQSNKETHLKKAELARQKKAGELQLDTLRHKTAELEKRLEAATNLAQSQQVQVKDAGPSPALQEAITKLEQSLRAIENEKSQLNEKLSNEQKRVAIFEQKYTALYKDLSAKDKELNELKAIVFKMKKDQQAAATAASPTATAANNGNDAARAKESEARENALKVELRKLSFKLENNDKNVKAIQTEASEKIKLLEQKLQGAKAKEVDLLKKIDDLAAALKKAAKAA